MELSDVKSSSIRTNPSLPADCVAGTRIFDHCLPPPELDHPLPSWHSSMWVSNCSPFAPLTRVHSPCRVFHFVLFLSLSSQHVSIASTHKKAHARFIIVAQTRQSLDVAANWAEKTCQGVPEIRLFTSCEKHEGGRGSGACAELGEPDHRCDLPPPSAEVRGQLSAGTKKLPGSGKSLAALLRDRRVNYISELLSATMYSSPVREKDFPVGNMAPVRAWRPIVGLILLVLSCKSPRVVSLLLNWVL